MPIPRDISHTTNVVEHPEQVAQRSIRFASILGREKVIGGPSGKHGAGHDP